MVVTELVRSVHFRGKYRLLSHLIPSTGFRPAVVHGTRFTLDLSDFIQRNMYLGTFEMRESQILMRNLLPNMTFCDVGANVGYYSALVAKQVGPGGKVIAFEPSPHAFERLARTVTDNGLSQVLPLQVGLGDERGEVNLYLGKGSKNHAPTMVPHEHATSTPVRVTTLDYVLDELGIGRIDVMKIDVEGYELKVLMGAAKTIQTRGVRYVLVELNESWLQRAGTSSCQVVEFLCARGFGQAERIGRSDNYWFARQPN